MSAFGDFMIDFNNWKNETGFEIDPNLAKSYGWRLGTATKELFLTHFDTEWPEADDTVRANFASCFEVGNTLLGAMIIGTAGGSHQNDVYLMQASEQKVSHNQSLDFKTNVHLGGAAQRMKDPVTSQLFSWPCIIKPYSLVVTADGYKRHDTLIRDYEGTFKIVEDDVATFGDVDYKEGTVFISRSSDANINLLHRLVSSYGQGSSSMAGSAGPVSMGPPPKIDYTNLSITGTIYTNPVKLLWKWVCNPSKYKRS